jgi:hypothetical protein
MRAAWFQVFRRSDSAPPVGSDHPEIPADDVDPVAIRDAAALAATRATVLEAAGLTPRAISAAHRLGVSTMGDFLDLGQKSFFNLPGIGAKTRQELQRRFREWRVRLGGTEPRPADEAAEQPKPAPGEEPTYDSLGLDGIRQLLVPKLQQNKRNATEVEATRLLLRLPDDSGDLPALPPWPQQPAVAAELGVTPGRVAQVLVKQRARWQEDPAVRGVRAELIGLLADSGRVMGFTELAEALLARRGSGAARTEVRRAIAVAAVRAAVEIDPLMDEPRLLSRRHGNQLLLALEVSEDESPDTPAAPALLDYADALGKVADRLAAQDVLPTPASVLRELRAVPDHGIVLEDRRLVQVGAVAAENASASPRLEIYPRNLPPVRALRLAQAGVVPIGLQPDGQPLGLRPEQIQEKLHARFPALPPLPGHPQLDDLLAEAGFDLRWRTDGKGRNGRYVAPQSEQSSSGTLLRRRSTRTGASAWAVTSPELAGALRTEEQLVASAAGGFRVLSVQIALLSRALAELTVRFGATPVNVAALFVDALHELVDARPKPTWETVLDADLAEPGSKSALKLREYTDAAWDLVEPQVAAARSGSAPLLLHDASVLARYDGMELLSGLASAARSGGTPVWVLCPAEDPARRPSLDRTLTPAQLPHEWIVLPDSWVANKHRSGAEAS